MSAPGGSAEDRPMRSPRTLLAIVALGAALLLGACGSGSSGTDDAATPGTEASGSTDTTASSADVEDALESQLPDETVEVPSADGATTIADWAAGGVEIDEAEANDLASILALVGTDADGYFTDDTLVIHREAADATLLCEYAKRAGLTHFEVIPVLPDGTGVACD